MASGNLTIYPDSDDEDEDGNDKAKSDQTIATGNQGTFHQKKEKSMKMEKFVYKNGKARILIALFRKEIDALNKEGKCKVEIQEQILQVILKCNGGQSLLAMKKEELDRFIEGTKTERISTVLDEDKKFIEDFLKRETEIPFIYMYTDKKTSGQHEYVFYGKSAEELKKLKDQLERELNTLCDKKNKACEGVSHTNRAGRFEGMNSFVHQSEEKRISDDDDDGDDDNDDDDAYSSFEMVENTSSSVDDHQVKIDLKGKGTVILEFCLKGGLCVQLIKGSITDVKCDAIVNAANEHIHNIGGVALAISKAAGHKFEEDCREIIRKTWKVKVTENVVTASGNLSCKAVIHAVGPSWTRYNDAETCFKDLLLTVENILETAEKKTFKTVVMPPISSGIFAVPKRACAAMYVKALTKYDEDRKSKVVKKFGIIDINDTVLNLVKETYEEWNKDKTKVDPHVVARNYSHSSQGRSRHGQDGWKTVENRRSHRDDRSWISNQRMTPCREMKKGSYKLGEKLDIHIYTTDIVSLQLGVLVIAEDRSFSGQGILTKKVKARGGQKYVKERDKKLRSLYQPRIGYVKATNAGDLKFSYVFHAIIEKFPSANMPDQQDLSILYDITKNILEKVEKGKKKWINTEYKDIKSIAMPLLGTGSIDNTHYLEKYCEAVYRAICDYVDEGSVTLSEVHLVNFKDNATDSFVKVFSSHAQKKSKGKVEEEKTNTHSGKQDRKENYNSGGHKQVSSATPRAGRMFNTFQPEKYTKIDEWNFFQKDTNVDVEKYLEPVPKITKKVGNLQLITSSDSEDEDEKLSSKAQSEDEKVDNSNCVICMCELDDPVQLTECHHRFCRGCISTQFSHKPICPVCGKTYDERYGNQPRDGCAKVYEDRMPLSGFEKYGTAIIDYHFPDGQQCEDHQNPGQKYEGLRRQAYLPLNEDGKEILQMLKRAFQQGLIFTIGTSRTSGKDNVLTWNDIHHKTRREGGPERYGYPDPEYLTRVREELNVKGIV